MTTDEGVLSTEISSRDAAAAAVESAPSSDSLTSMAIIVAGTEKTAVMSTLAAVTVMTMYASSTPEICESFCRRADVSV